MFLSPLFPTLGLAAALVVTTVGRVAIERRRADVAVHERTTAQRLMVESLLSLTSVRDAETGGTRAACRIRASSPDNSRRIHASATI
jgi:hypothetical protein